MNKQKLTELIGPFPDKVPLEPETVESEDCGSYIREKVEYNVETDEPINAYLLIPKGIGEPRAAIFCHHQHAGNHALGKSEVVGLDGDPDQAYAHELAERGFVTFAPDAIAFEERNWGNKGGMAEYFELSSRLVQGKTLLAKCLHDVSVGIDYLTTRVEVDKNRIGFIGHSYGGRMAIWAAAFDKRIKATVASGGSVRFKDSLTRDRGFQMAFCVPGIMKYGELDDVIRLIDPASLLISACKQDKWSLDAEALFNSCKSMFKVGELKLQIYEGGHVFTSEMRENAYEFLDIHLSSSVDSRPGAG